MATLSPTPKLQFFDANGVPLVGGKLYTYEAGTTTPLATYTDSSGGSFNTNPIILDARGEANVWLGSSSYKFVLKTSTDVEIWTVDNVESSLGALAQPNGSALVGFIANGSGAVATTVQVKLREFVSTHDFGAVGDAVADDTTALANAMASRVSGGIVVPTQTAYQYGQIPPGFVFVNTNDYATAGSVELFTNNNFTGSAAGWTVFNFTYGANKITKTVGGIGSVSQTVTLKAFRMYKFGLSVVTSALGQMQIYLNGDPQLDVSVGTFLGVGTAANNFYNIMPSTTGAQTVEIRFTSEWAGDVDSFSLIELAEEWKTPNEYAPTDDTMLRIPCSVRFGRYNAGNIAIGDKKTMAFGQSAAVWNVAVGVRALSANETGFENTAIGTFSQEATQTSRNTSVGYSSLKNNTTGAENTAIGYKALIGNVGGSYNTAIGFQAGFYNVDGTNNVYAGWQCMRYAHSGNYNVALGAQIGVNNALEGAGNIYIGPLSMNLSAVDQKEYNISYNTVVGAEAKIYGQESIAIGHDAIIGAEQFYDISPISGSLDYCSAIGKSSRCYGRYSNAIGRGAIVGTTSSIFAINNSAYDYSTVIGDQAASYGTLNTVIGAGASIGTSATTTSFWGVAIGAIATVTATQSVAIGYGAISAAQQGAAIGLLAKATGDYTLAFGSQAGTGETGARNTFLGPFAGYTTTTLSYTNVTCLGYNSQITGSNQIQLGDSATTVYAYGAVQNRSDARDKADVRDTALGLDFITALRPVDFKWDLRADYNELVQEIDENGNPIAKIITHKKDGSRKRARYHHGLIAQEVKNTLDAIGLDFGGYQDHNVNNGEDVLSIGYTELIAPLIKAVQELAERVKALEDK